METSQTRPKSSKGRRRDNIMNDNESFPGRNGESTFMDTFCPRPQPATRHFRDFHPGQIQSKASSGASPRGQSLNRFKVLPSIERGRPKTSPDVETEVPSFDSTGQRSSQQRQSAALSTDDSEVAPSPDTLLLAIRDPGGRRFQQRFNHTDTLLRVRASAEEKFGARYGEKASIETMEVPRRSFTDMSRTLSQCGVGNKSVLCIYEPQDD